MKYIHMYNMRDLELKIHSFFEKNLNTFCGGIGENSLTFIMIINYVLNKICLK